MTVQAILAGLVEEFAQIVDAYGESRATVTSGEFPQGRQVVATFAAGGAHRGRCAMVLDYAGAEAVARLLGSDGGDAAISAGLRSLFAQSAAALAARDGEARMDLTLEDVESTASMAATPTSSAWAVTIGGLAAPVAIGLVWTPATGASATAPSAAAAGPAAREERIEDRIDVILDIDLPVVVRFGRTELPIRQLTRLGVGSVIDLGRSPDDPVELLVSNRVVAHGEVVVVGGNYGIRILDVASPSERVRSMGA